MIINANNIDALKQFPDNHFDSIVTDPPYGLGKEPDASELMKDWLEKGYHEIKGTGFMGKDWDAFVPQPLFWKEVFRVLKPGGHCLAFYGTRTYDWGVMAIRFAGFEIRDCIQWLYGSGFPKSHNISKAIDKIYVKDGKQWEGWGSALKPANEPIVLARKPLEKGLSIAENVLKWGTGGINIDGCRVGYSENDDKRISKGYKWESKAEPFGVAKSTINKEGWNKEGRFPANIILDEEAAELLDEQSGVKASTRNMSYNRGGGDFIDGIPNQKEKSWFKSEVGGASRFFYVAKASKSERNNGLENNFHPTVKPIKLMQYLVRLVTPPNGIVLDPFSGSGTTGIACKLEGFEFVGIEQDAEYCKIAEARIKSTVIEIKLF